MSAPVVYGGLGLPGGLGLGGPQPPLSVALPLMPKKAEPYVLHLYDRNMVFKRTVGGVKLISKPSLKQTQNGTFQPITLSMTEALPTGANLAVNGSFEPTANASGVWGAYNNSPGPEPMTFADISNGTAFDGLNFVRLNWTVNNTSTKGIYGGAASGTLWQQNTTYTISWWARATGTNVGQTMALAWNNGPSSTVIVQNPPLTNTWQRYIFTITWGPGPVEPLGPLYIYISSATQGTLDFDLVQVVQGPKSAREAILLGDVGRITERGDNAGTILYSGNIETTPEEQGVDGTHHLLTLTPWGAELASAYVNRNYSTLTDVAQFVRDAAAATAHCSVSPLTCPDTGIKATYDFQQSNGLDAVHVAKQIAGSGYWYGVDAEGRVWFQPVNLQAPAMYTFRKGADYNSKKPVATIEGLHNVIPVIGGNNPGDTGKLSALYNNPTSRDLYGTRTFNPTPSYPTVTSQAVLDAIAASLGAQYDRPQNRVEVELPTYPYRLTPYRAGGLTARFFDPTLDPLLESGEPGPGGYSPTFMLQDVDTLGTHQSCVFGDVPYADIDTTYEASRIAQRIGVVAPTAVPTLPVAPPVNPPPPPPVAQQNVQYNFTCSAGIYTMGGGQVQIGFVTFTTPRAGVCQFLGQVDARMEAWDNYVGAPRRDVWGELTGIVVNGRQELPFGITRQVWASNSASGIAIPQGTYTARWYIQTTGYNQMHIYSGWGQVAWTG